MSSSKKITDTDDQHGFELERKPKKSSIIGPHPSPMLIIPYPNLFMNIPLAGGYDSYGKSKGCNNKNCSWNNNNSQQPNQMGNSIGFPMRQSIPIQMSLPTQWNCQLTPCCGLTKTVSNQEHNNPPPNTCLCFQIPSIPICPQIMAQPNGCTSMSPCPSPPKLPLCECECNDTHYEVSYKSSQTPISRQKLCYCMTSFPNKNRSSRYGLDQAQEQRITIPIHVASISQFPLVTHTSNVNLLSDYDVQNGRRRTSMYSEHMITKYDMINEDEYSAPRLTTRVVVSSRREPKQLPSSFRHYPLTPKESPPLSEECRSPCRTCSAARESPELTTERKSSFKDYPLTHQSSFQKYVPQLAEIQRKTGYRSQSLPAHFGNPQQQQQQNHKSQPCDVCNACDACVGSDKVPDCCATTSIGPSLFCPEQMMQEEERDIFRKKLLNDCGCVYLIPSVLGAENCFDRKEKTPIFCENCRRCSNSFQYTDYNNCNNNVPSTNCQEKSANDTNSSLLPLQKVSRDSKTSQKLSTKKNSKDCTSKNKKDCPRGSLRRRKSSHRPYLDAKSHDTINIPATKRKSSTVQKKESKNLSKSSEKHSDTLPVLIKKGKGNKNDPPHSADLPNSPKPYKEIRDQEPCTDEQQSCKDPCVCSAPAVPCNDTCALCNDIRELIGAPPQHYSSCDKKCALYAMNCPLCSNPCDVTNKAKEEPLVAVGNRMDSDNYSGPRRTFPDANTCLTSNSLEELKKFYEMHCTSCNCTCKKDSLKSHSQTPLTRQTKEFGTSMRGLPEIAEPESPKSKERRQTPKKSISIIETDAKKAPPEKVQPAKPVAPSPKATIPRKSEPKIPLPRKSEPKIPLPRKSEPKIPLPKKSEPKIPLPKKSEPKIPLPRKSEPKIPLPRKSEPKIPLPRKSEPKIQSPKPPTPKVPSRTKIEPPKRDSRIPVPNFKPKKTPSKTSVVSTVSSKKLPPPNRTESLKRKSSLKLTGKACKPSVGSIKSVNDKEKLCCCSIVDNPCAADKPISPNIFQDHCCCPDGEQKMDDISLKPQTDFICFVKPNDVSQTNTCCCKANARKITSADPMCFLSYNDLKQDLCCRHEQPAGFQYGCSRMKNNGPMCPGIASRPANRNSRYSPGNNMNNSYANNYSACGQQTCPVPFSCEPIGNSSFIPNTPEQHCPPPYDFATFEAQLIEEITQQPLCCYSPPYSPCSYECDRQVESLSQLIKAILPAQSQVPLLPTNPQSTINQQRRTGVSSNRPCQPVRAAADPIFQLYKPTGLTMDRSGNSCNMQCNMNRPPASSFSSGTNSDNYCATLPIPTCSCQCICSENDQSSSNTNPGPQKTKALDNNSRNFSKKSLKPMNRPASGTEFLSQRSMESTDDELLSGENLANQNDQPAIISQSPATYVQSQEALESSTPLTVEKDTKKVDNDVEQPTTINSARSMTAKGPAKDNSKPLEVVDNSLPTETMTVASNIRSVEDDPKKADDKVQQSTNMDSAQLAIVQEATSKGSKCSVIKGNCMTSATTIVKKTPEEPNSLSQIKVKTCESTSSGKEPELTTEKTTTASSQEPEPTTAPMAKLISAKSFNSSNSTQADSMFEIGVNNKNDEMLDRGIWNVLQAVKIFEKQFAARRSNQLENRHTVNKYKSVDPQYCLNENTHKSKGSDWAKKHKEFAMFLSDDETPRPSTTTFSQTESETSNSNRFPFRINGNRTNKLRKLFSQPSVFETNIIGSQKRQFDRVQQKSADSKALPKLRRGPFVDPTTSTGHLWRQHYDKDQQQLFREELKEKLTYKYSMYPEQKVPKSSSHTLKSTSKIMNMFVKPKRAEYSFSNPRKSIPSEHPLSEDESIYPASSCSSRQYSVATTNVERERGGFRTSMIKPRKSLICKSDYSVQSSLKQHKSRVLTSCPKGKLRKVSKTVRDNDKEPKRYIGTEKTHTAKRSTLQTVGSQHRGKHSNRKETSLRSLLKVKDNRNQRRPLSLDSFAIFSSLSPLHCDKFVKSLDNEPYNLSQERLNYNQQIKPLNCVNNSFQQVARDASPSLCVDYAAWKHYVQLQQSDDFSTNSIDKPNYDELLEMDVEASTIEQIGAAFNSSSIDNIITENFTKNQQSGSF